MRIEMAVLAALTLLALVQLVACRASSSVTPTDRAAAEAFVRGEEAPLPVSTIAVWYADVGAGSHATCGEIKAPAALARIRPTLRYMYFADQKFGSVEPHELLVATDPSSAAILQESRTLFGRTWTTFCQPSAPLTRRIADWWSGIDKFDDAPTPITDAYMGSLLNKTR